MGPTTRTSPFARRRPGLRFGACVALPNEETSRYRSASNCGRGLSVRFCFGAANAQAPEFALILHARPVHGPKATDP
eukprot:8279872-Alexandrium_andersonii.AAC.1